MKILRLLAGLGAVLAITALTACSLTAEQSAALDKAYDASCTNVPAFYQSFVTLATAKGVSERTMQRAATIYASAVQLCETRPKDIASAAVQLSNLYAQLVLIGAQVERQPARVLVPS